MRTERGFTIIEVAVALGLLAVALLATLAAIGMGGQLRQTSRESELAAELLNDRLEHYQPLGKITTAGLPWQQTVTNALVAEATFTDTRLPQFSGQAFVLDELDAAATFAIDKDGTAGNDPLDLDDDGNTNESGVNRGGVDDLPAAWNQGKLGAHTSDVHAYLVIPIRVVITWRTLTGGTKTLSGTTLVYPKG